MKRIVGLVLLIVGGCLCYAGWAKRESLAGKMDKLAASTVNSFNKNVSGDPERALPDYAWYFAGGGVLMVVGGALAARKG